jgi:hypothetical protein
MSHPNIIARTTVGTIGGSKYVVSTVRLAGADRTPDLYGGLIFETMVFPCDARGTVTDWQELEVQQYRTIDEAYAGHDDMVENWTDRS